VRVPGINPARVRSWLHHGWSKTRSGASRSAHAARPVLLNVLSIPLTIAGVGCIDAGVFMANTIAGMIFTGVSLIVLEHLIADE
jgi:hypothetical protein